MPLKSLRKRVSSITLSPAYGTIISIGSNSIIATGLKASIGQSVTILSGGKRRLGMVTSLGSDSFTISPFGFLEGMKVGDRVLLNRRSLEIPVGENLLGRVVDPFMNPIDGKGAIHLDEYEEIMKPPMDVMKRGLIDEPFSVGVKSIDGLLTSGKGQKVGIFAGSGVGKSTLMGMIVKGCEAPVKVVALIGERGREVPEFIAKNLGNDLTDTVIVVATSDDSALMRKYGAFSAMSVAEYFKRQGRDVLFMMDFDKAFSETTAEQFVAESEEIIPAAVAALQQQDWATFGAAVRRSQELGASHRLIGPKKVETPIVVVVDKNGSPTDPLLAAERSYGDASSGSSIGESPAITTAGQEYVIPHIGYEKVCIFKIA